MILVKKKQSGGLFAPSQMNFGVKDFSGLLQQYDTRDSYRGTAGRSSGTKSSGATASGGPSDGLSSDVQYYNSKKSAIKAEMEKGAEDPNYTNTEAYKQLAKDWYDLDANYLPAIKSKQKLYSTGLTNLRASGFNAPAVHNGEVIVTDSNGTPRVISDMELMKNPNAYNIMTVGDAATKRASDPTFSGFTHAGELVDALMNNAYGQGSFDKSLTSNIKRLGYTKVDGRKVQKDGGDPFDIDAVTFDGDGTRFSVKSNKGQIADLLDNMMLSASPAEKNFVSAMALQQLHSKAKRGTEVNTKKMSQGDLAELINSNVGTYLFKQLRPAIKQSAGLGPTEGGTTDDDKWGKANKDINNIQFAELLMMNNKGTIEHVIGVDNKSLLYKVPSAKIDKGDLLIYRDGFVGAGHKKDEDMDESEQGKNLMNNTFIRNATGSLDNLSLADGTQLKDVLMEGNMKLATVDPSTSLYTLIAPIKQINGVDVVTFESEYEVQLMEATTAAMQIFKDLEVSDEDLIEDSGSEKVREAEKRVNAVFQELTDRSSGLKLGFALAFDAEFITTKEGKDNPLIDADSKWADGLKSRVGEKGGNKAAHAKVFMPMGSTFHASLFSPDALGADYKMRLTNSTANAALKSSTNVKVGGSYTEDLILSYVTDIKGKNKKEGGKFATADDINEIFSK